MAGVEEGIALTRGIDPVELVALCADRLAVELAPKEHRRHLVPALLADRVEALHGVADAAGQPNRSTELFAHLAADGRLGRLIGFTRSAGEPAARRPIEGDRADRSDSTIGSAHDDVRGGARVTDDPSRGRSEHAARHARHAVTGRGAAG